jgi:hypothetical protein
MLRMQAEILFCRKKRESERQTREGKGRNEVVHTRGNSECGNEKNGKFEDKRQTKREIGKEKEREKKKGKKECERNGKDEEGNYRVYSRRLCFICRFVGH